MDTITCTNCGLRGSAADAFCTRCGMSRTGGPSRGPSRTSGSGSGSQVGKWIAILAVCGFGGIFVIGILAAIAIPKFANVSRSAKASEAEIILEQIHLLERSHHAANGEFTSNLHDPAAADHLVGWTEPGTRYFTFSVSRATAGELCIEATPSAEGEAAGLDPVSMDGEGMQYAGAGCTGPSVEEWEGPAADDVSRRSESRPTLNEIHTLQVRAREKGGRFVADLAALDGLQAPDGEFFTFRVSQATDEELCVEARPTAMGKKAGVVGTSIDEAGQFYLGYGCTGTRLPRTSLELGGTGARAEEGEAVEP